MTSEQDETPTRWERRRELTYQRLVAAGERLFRIQGFDATTVEEIATAADVAKGTYFNYFSSKESLLGELLYARIRPLLEDPPLPDAPAPERIWALLATIHEELMPYVHLFQRMFAYALTTPHPQKPADDRTLAQALARLVVEGQDQGVFRPDHNASMAGALLATYFFRLSVLECVDTLEYEFCWEDQMRAGLELLYAGLASSQLLSR